MAKRDRREKDHERYLRNREAILAYQKEYRATHREEIKARRRARYKKKEPGKKFSRHDYNQVYYMKHRDEIIARNKRYYVRKQQQLYPTADGTFGDT